jgi:hypothetical protein
VEKRECTKTLTFKFLRYNNQQQIHLIIAMGRHGRSLSFRDIDCEQASGILGDVLKENDVFLGGSSIGKGLKKAANYYLSERSMTTKLAPHLSLPGAKDLALEGDAQTPTEEAFYVVDLGVVVSQVYQCKWWHWYSEAQKSTLLDVTTITEG